MTTKQFAARIGQAILVLLVTYTSSNGIVEIFYGEPFNERAWQLESASTMVTETGPKNSFVLSIKDISSLPLT